MLSNQVHALMLLSLICIAICLIACLLRAILGPRFTDRLVAVNLITTKTILMLCLAAVLIGEAYLVDVALVYALISFLSVVVLTRLYRSQNAGPSREGITAEDEGGDPT